MAVTHWRLRASLAVWLEANLHQRSDHQYELTPSSPLHREELGICLPSHQECGARQDNGARGRMSTTEIKVGQGLQTSPQRTGWGVMEAEHLYLQGDE